MIDNENTIHNPMITNETSSNQNKNKEKEKAQTKEELHHNLSVITREIQSHVKSTKKQHLNDTVHDILTNIHEEEYRKISFFQGGSSILDLDFLNDLKQKVSPVKKKRNKNKSQPHQPHVSTQISIPIKREKSSKSSPSISLDSNHNLNSSSFYKREQMFIQKKNHEIDLKRNAKRENDSKNCSHRPELNKNTLKMVKKKNEKPLYLRTQEVLEKKHNKIENLKRINEESKKISNENANILFKNLQPHHKDQTDKWIEEQAAWLRKKQEKIDRIKIMIQTETEAGESTHRPAINKTSEILVKMKTQGDEETTNSTYYDRLYSEHRNKTIRHQKLYDEHLPSFSPIINKTKPSVFLPQPSFLDINQAIRNGKTKTPTKKRNKFCSSERIQSSESQNDQMKISFHNDSGSKLKSGENNNKSNSYSYTSDKHEQVGRFQESSPNTHSIKNNRKDNRLDEQFEKLKKLKKLNEKLNENLLNVNENNDNNNVDNSPNKQNGNYLYKLNIRSASAWDNSQQNSVYYNAKFKSLVKKIIK